MSIDDNLKVLHIASGDLWAGAEVQLKTLACTLHREKMCRVNVLLLNHGRLEEELRRCGIAVTVLDEKCLGSIALFRSMASTIRSLMPDIVHTHRMKENILGSVASFISGHIPSIRTEHGANEHPPTLLSPRRLQFFANYLCGRWLQDQIIAVTTPLAVELRHRFPEEKVRVIENGIETSIEHHAAIGDGSFNIGIVGRLAPVKRIDMFLRAAHLLIARNTDKELRFHVYGDGPLLDELVRLRDELGLKDAVNFHGHRDDIHHAIAELQILMITSDHEGLPMTLLEAMLLDTTVVAHSVGGITEVLNHGLCGVLIEDHNAAAYANGVQRCIDSPGNLPETRANAQQRVRKHYTASANATATTTLYHEIVDI